MIRTALSNTVAVASMIAAATSFASVLAPVAGLRYAPAGAGARQQCPACVSAAYEATAESLSASALNAAVRRSGRVTVAERI
jgi:hypothetical protein